MGKYAHDDMLDGSLNIVKANANLMCVCSTQPTTRAEAVSSYKLASVAMTVSTDYTLGNGSPNGREVAVAAKNSVSVDTTGSAEHIALVDGTRLLYVTTCTKQSISSGNKVNIPSWKITISDPS